MQDFFYDLIDKRTGQTIELKVRARTKADADAAAVRRCSSLSRRQLINGNYVSSAVNVLTGEQIK